MRSRPDLRRIVSALDRDLPVYGLITGTSRRAAADGEPATARQRPWRLRAARSRARRGRDLRRRARTRPRSAPASSGMRMALGARQSAVLWLVLKQGVGLTMLGAVVGLAGGLGLGRVLVVDDAESSGAGVLDHARRLRVHGGCGAGRFLHSSLARIEDQSDARPAPRIALGRRV